jgi:hypothetical protein
VTRRDLTKGERFSGPQGVGVYIKLICTSTCWLRTFVTHFQPRLDGFFQPWEQTRAHLTAYAKV